MRLQNTTFGVPQVVVVKFMHKACSNFMIGLGLGIFLGQGLGIYIRVMVGHLG